MVLQGPLYAVGAGTAVGIVLNKDTNPRKAQVRQMVNNRFGLLAVRGAHVKHVAIMGWFPYVAGHR